MGHFIYARWFPGWERSAGLFKGCSLKKIYIANMTAQKKSVYIETTIPSLITARTSRDLITAYRQDISKLFWENERNKYDLFISQYVFAECSDGDADAAKRRLELIKDISYIPITEEIEELADEYFSRLGIPSKAKTDCFHLAVSVVGKINYLMSWNMTHLGGHSYNKVAEYNYKRSLWLPKMYTPDAIMDAEREEVENGLH
jgi:hypothetical protein